MSQPLRLGVNIDHVATIRNARGGPHPDPVRAAIMAAEAGAILTLYKPLRPNEVLQAVAKAVESAAAAPGVNHEAVGA